MPVSIIDRGNGQYMVRTPNGVHSYHTSLENAKKQRNLLNALEHNKNFKPHEKTFSIPTTTASRIN